MHTHACNLYTHRWDTHKGSHDAQFDAHPPARTGDNATDSTRRRFKRRLQHYTHADRLKARMPLSALTQHTAAAKMMAAAR
jgi:hypothetical protein